MKPVVIFDLDGTLIDTPRGIVEAFYAALKSLDVAFNDTSTSIVDIELLLVSGNLDINIMDAQALHAIKLYQKLFKDIVLPKAKELVFPGVERGLASLQSQGFTLAIATSKIYNSAEALLKAANLWRYFSLVVGSNQVTRQKPHQEMALLILNTLGALPENAIMIGDTPQDIKMAKNAGMHSIAVTYGVHDKRKLKSYKPTWVVDTFEGVMDCIGQYSAW